jgi:hypothetical protein
MKDPRVVLALLLCIPTILGGLYLVLQGDSLVFGSPEPTSELRVLGEAATEEARDLAQRCDAAEGAACWRLHRYYLSEDEGLPRSIAQARRLCRKACQLKVAEACRQWEVGAAVCPASSI